MNKKLLNLLLVIMMLAVLVPTALAAPPVQEGGQDYVVVADDWLSKLADKYLGNTLAYPAIVEYTNQKNAEDASYAKITDPDLIEVGWKIYIPSAEEAAAPELAVAPAAEDQELVFRVRMDILDMDPAHLKATVDYGLCRNVYSGLVKYASTGFAQAEPDLATEWTVSDDGLVYTFKLREGVKWHHGYGEVTANDVKFSMERLVDPDVASRYKNEASIIDHVEVVNDYEVKLHLKNPWPGFLTEFLAYRPGFIVSQKAVEELGEQLSTNPVGSGPFVWTEWVPKSHIILTANPDYFGDTGKLSRVKVVIIEEDALFEIALEKGDVDIGYMQDGDIQKSLMENPSLETLTLPAPQTMYLMINGEREPFNDVRVRQALWYATDKEALIEFVLKGQGAPADTIMNPYVFGYLGGIVYGYNPEKAKELLREAGYPDGFDTTIQVRPQQLEDLQGTALQAIWKEVGVNVEVVGPIESALAFERFRNGDFDIGTVAMMRFGPDQYMRPLYHSGSIPRPNSSRYSVPEMDALIDTAQSETDEQKRIELYHQIQRKAQEDAPMIPLYNPLLVLSMRPNVQGATIPNVQALLFSEIYKSE